MRGVAKKLHENQHVGWRRDQSLPRKRGFSAEVIQSADGADVALLPRLSSAWANNSASFGSFPAVSRVSRSRTQEIAARRAGQPSPWQDQPPGGWQRQARAGIHD